MSVGVETRTEIGWQSLANSEEKHEPASDIDTAVVESLKVLDPEWSIREADIGQLTLPIAMSSSATVQRSSSNVL
jgi:hypothetical protein